MTRKSNHKNVLRLRISTHNVITTFLYAVTIICIVMASSHGVIVPRCIGIKYTKSSSSSPLRAHTYPISLLSPPEALTIKFEAVVQMATSSDLRDLYFLSLLSTLAPIAFSRDFPVSTANAHIHCQTCHHVASWARCVSCRHRIPSR